MVARVKEEYMAAGIRQQIQSLEVLQSEIESEKLGTDALAWRIKAVELQLKRLREAA